MDVDHVEGEEPQTQAAQTAAEKEPRYQLRGKGKGKPQPSDADTVTKGDEASQDEDGKWRNSYLDAERCCSLDIVSDDSDESSIPENVWCDTEKHYWEGPKRFPEGTWSIDEFHPRLTQCQQAVRGILNALTNLLMMTRFWHAKHVRRREGHVSYTSLLPQDVSGVLTTKHIGLVALCPRSTARVSSSHTVITWRSSFIPFLSASSWKVSLYHFIRKTSLATPSLPGSRGKQRSVHLRGQRRR